MAIFLVSCMLALSAGKAAMSNQLPSVPRG